MSTVPASSPLRVLCYSHDSYGLGHFRRTLSVARGIVEEFEDATVLCVTGSPCPEIFELPPRTDYVKLPAITKGPNGDYVARDLPAGIADVVDIRGQAILSLVRSFRPDVVLVDHTATGVHDELLPMLEELRTRRPDVHVALGMRDIIDEPRRVIREFQERQTLRVLDRYYDTILVYGHQSLFDIVANYQLPTHIASRVQYLGYACAAFCPAGPKSVESNGSGPSNHLLATAGGGGDGYQMLNSLLGAFDRLPPERSFSTATLVAGPFMPKEEFEALLQKAARLPVEVVRSTTEFESLMTRADVVVAMGGYNTVTEALCLDKRLLVIPRARPRKEQVERATRFAERGLLSWISPDRAADPSQLARALVEVAGSDRPDARGQGLRFDGARRAARVLADAALERQSPGISSIARNC